MVGIVSGNGFGLMNSSAAVLGQQGLFGSAAFGQTKESAYLNVASGSLMLQERDDFLAAVGISQSLTRTYNSQGAFNQDHQGANWHGGLTKSIVQKPDTSLVRTDSDGSTSLYIYDSATNAYLSHDGAGNVKSLTVTPDGIWTWRDNAKDQYGRYETYDPNGRLIAAGDQTGVRLRYQYDDNTLVRVDSVTSGESTNFIYENNNLVRIEVAAKDSTNTLRNYTRVKYGYDALNRLTSVTVDLTPDDGVFGTDTYTTRYTYDGNSSRVATVTQDDGSKLVIGYTGVPAAAPTEWKVGSLTDALGRTTTISYGGGATTVTDPQGKQTTYRYDDQGRLTEVAGPDVNGSAAGGVQLLRYTYDANGNVKSVDDGQGHVTTYTYDAQDNRIGQRDQAGNTISRTFNAANMLLTETRYLEPDTGAGTAALPAATTRYVYDATNRLHYVLTPEGRVTEYKYGTAEKDQVIAAIQYNATVYNVSKMAANAVPTEAEMNTWAAATANRARAGRIDYTYDARGLLTKTATYDAVTSTLAGSGTAAITTHIYDRAGQLIKTIDGNANATSYVYDGLGRVIASTDPLNNTQTASYAYGADGITVTGQQYTGSAASGVKAGAASVSTYDLAGQLVSSGSVAGPSAALTTYTYDAAGRVRVSENAVGQRQYWVYDAAGRKTATVDTTGALTEYVYNDANQLVMTTTYATRIRVAALTDANGKPADVSVESLRPAASAADRSTWNYYDTTGRLATQVDAEGYVSRQFYDAASRLVRTVRYANQVAVPPAGTNAPVPVVSADDRVSRAFYDLDGNVTGKLDADGYLVENKYDGGGRLIETIAYATATDAAKRADGTLDALRPASHANDIRQRLFYNGENQLIATIDGDNYLTDIVYDLNGNVTSRVRYATAVTLAAGADVATLARPSSTENRTTTYTYTKANRVLQEKAPDGTITQYSYDTAGNVTAVQRAFGVTADARDANYRYDAFGRVVAELSAEGAALLSALPAGMTVDSVWNQYATRYTYDTAGRRTSATDANNHTSYYYYDAASRLSVTVNAAGEVQQRTYDVFGQLESTTAYARRIDVTGLTGGAADTVLASLAQLASDADVTTRYRYDRKGQLVDTTDAIGYHTLTTYDAFGDIVKSARETTNKLGYISTAYRYDHRGNLVQSLPFEDAAYATKVEYDGFGRAIRRTDANGNATTLGYDHLGHVISMQSPSTPAALTTYDAFGQVLTETDSLGNKTTYTYNLSARSMTVTTPEGVKHTTVRNRYGQTVSIADTTGTTTYAYDRNGNLTSVSDTLGTRQTNTYDRAGLQLTTTDANGTVTAFAYDAANRVLTRTVDPAGLRLTTTYAYDALGQTMSVQDPQGGTTRTSYDKAGRVTTIVAPGGATTTISYDSRGNVLTKTAPDGVQTIYAYNEKGYGSYSIVDGVRTDVVYDSTGKNLLLRSTNQQQSTRYAYDANNRLVWEIDPTGAVTGYTYDTDGQLIQTTRYANRSTLITADTKWNATFDAATIAASVVPDTSRDATTRTVYDKDGRVYGKVDATGTATVYRAYDAAGRPIDAVTYTTPVTLTASTVAALNSAVASQSLSTAQRTFMLYDARGRVTAALTATAYNASTAAQAWAVRTYTYDANGNVTGTTSYSTTWEVATPTVAALTTWQASAAKASDAAVQMRYDRANRLVATATAQSGTGAARTWSMTFQSYDRAGNVVERRTAAALVTGTTPSAADFANATVGTADSVERYQYDAQGRVTGTAVLQGRDADGKAQWAIATREYSVLGLPVRAVQYATLYVGDLPADIGAVAASLAGTRDRVSRNAYDHAGHLLATVNAENEATAFVYDSRGNAVQTIQYGKIDNAEAFLAGSAPGAADARVTRTAFDLDDRPVLRVDALGNVTEMRYDALGNTVATIAYATPLDATRLAQLPQAASVQDVRNILVAEPLKDRVTRHVYDGDGRVRYTVDAAGYVTENRYDELGRVTAQLAYPTAKSFADANLAADVAKEATAQAASARTTSYTYDQQGNVLTRKDAAGGIETYTYDGAGRQLTYKDQLGNIWNYAYDAAGRRITETSPKVAAYTNALATTMGNWGAGTQQSLVTQYAYDAFGNLARKTEAAGTAMERVTAYAYDLVGRLVTTTLPAIKVYDAEKDPLSSAGGVGAYEKVSDPRTIKVTYDAFGNAVATKDVGGVVSYNVFDKLGRVSAEIDALGYVTTYRRNGFGETEELTRYANSIGSLAAAPDAATLAGRLVRDPAADRTIRTEYDRLGRVVLVREPVVEVYEPHALGQSALIHAGKTTATSYDAFSQVVKREVYGADLQGTKVTEAAVTQFYYDLRGNTVARVDALSNQPGAQQGYLSTYTYDLAGNVLTKIEYSTAITAWNDTATPTAVVAALDRKTSYTYDAMNRVLSETAVGVTYTDNTSTGQTVTGDVTTAYTYNTRGERTSVKDALKGIAYTYYDALGRITGTAKVQSAAVTGIATAGARLTEYKRDIRGNVVLSIEYAQGASGTPTVSGATPTSLTDVNNRVTATAYDIDGNAIQVLDPEQYSKAAAARSASYASYDVYGRAVKQWRSVTNGTASQTTFQVTRYDVLGHTLETITPNDRAAGNTTLQDRVAYEYNSFGELTKTSLGDYYRYDQAGNAWLSNASGIDQVALHDVMGQVTVAIRSTSTADRHALQSLSTGADALLLDDVLRTDTRYDLLGHRIDVTDSASNHAELLQSVGGKWVKTTSAINKTQAGSLLIIGRPEETGRTFTVRYRRLSDSTWIDAPASSVAWVGGYPTFNTAGLAGGDYVYQVHAQPAGEPAYQSATGTLTVATRETMLAQAKQVIALYLLVTGRAPTQAEVDAALRGLDAGKTLPQLASALLGTADAAAFLTGATPVEDYFVNVLHKDLADPQVAQQVRAIKGKLDLTDRDAWYNGEAIVQLLSLSTTVLNRRASALLNYLVIEGGSDIGTAAKLVADADVLADGAIAEGTSAARAERQRDQVIGLYLALFGKIPAKQDAEAWVSSLQTGAATLAQVAQGLVDTLSNAGDTPEQTLRAVIAAVFEHLLGRSPTEQELADRVAQAQPAEGGLTPGQVAVNFLAEVTGYLGADNTMALARTTLFDKVKLAQAFMSSPAGAGDNAVTVGSAYIDRVVTAASVASAADATVILLYRQIVSAQRALQAIDAAVDTPPAEVAQLQVARLYVAMLGRAPETDELTEGMQIVGSAPDGLVSLARLLDHAASAADGTFPAGLSDTEFVNRFYTSLYGAAPDALSLMNWTEFVASHGRPAAAVGLMNALLTDSRASAADAKKLFENKASASVTYARYISFGDRKTGRELVQGVTLTDVGAALAAASAATAPFRDELLMAAEQIETFGKTNQLLQAQSVLTTSPLAQAALLYTVILKRGITIPAAELEQLATVITTSGIYAAAQRLLDSPEAKQRYGSELTDGAGYALASHIYRDYIGIEPPSTPGSMDYWAGYLVRDSAHAIVDMMGPQIISVPGIGSVNTLIGPYRAWLSYMNAYMALKYASGQTSPDPASKWGVAMQSLNPISGPLYGLTHAGPNTEPTRTVQPEIARLLQATQAIMVVPGLAITRANVTEAVTALEQGGSLGQLVADLLLRSDKFNPQKLDLAAATAAVSREFAAELFARLNPPDAAGGYPADRIDALWDRLRNASDIGALMTELANPLYGAATPAAAQDSIASAAYIAKQVNTQVKALWPSIDMQISSSPPPASPTSPSLTVDMYALYFALRGNTGAAPLLFNGALSLSQPLQDFAEALFALDDVKNSFVRDTTNQQFVEKIYAAFGWPATESEIAEVAATFPEGADRAEFARQLVYGIVHYAGTDMVRLTRRVAVMDALQAQVASDKAFLDQELSQAQSALQAGQEVAGMPLSSSDIELLGTDSAALHSVIGSVQPKITVDRWGNVLSVADARDPNWKVSYTYNYRNEQLDQTANTLTGTAAAFHTEQRYDALGRLVMTRDASGNVNRRGYDVHGNVVTETHADGGVVTSTYNLFGERLSVQQPATALAGVKRNYAYDHLGNLLRTWTDAAVDVYVATDTGQASLTATKTATKQLVDSFTYDELGRRISSTDASGVVTKQFYDLNGDVVKTVDGLGYETNSTYDALHRLIKQVDANGKEKSWVYDADGLLTESYDMAGNVTHYSYNAAGQLVQQTSSLGQDIRYTYSGANVARIDDVATGLSTEYTYDAAGNRLTEKQSYAAWVARLPEHVQNNRLTYDMQNRLVTIQDDQYKLTYSYDNNGNRTQMRTEYDDVVFDAFNTYDSMNRQLIVNGERDNNGLITLGKYGHEITYDKAGNRLTDKFFGVGISKNSSGAYVTTADQYTVEKYTYDAVGRLATIMRDVLLVDTRHYDAAGRIAESGFFGTANTTINSAAAQIGLSAESKTYAYDANGHTTRQMSKALGGVGLVDIKYTAPGATTGYDKVGNVLGYTVTNLMAGTTDSYLFEYDIRNGYAEKNLRLNNSSSTTSTYDVNGQRIGIDKLNIETGETSTTGYWYDADGHIQSRKEGEETTFSLIVNGSVLGNETKTRENIIGQNYASATSAVYTAAPTIYVAQEGDTLASIAKRLWGDESLWYLIGDLNGLDSGASLSAGRTLKIPPRANTLHNSFNTFRPYSASDALGNTMPLATPGNKENCGAMGDIVTAAVAVAATYVTVGTITKRAVEYLSNALGSQAAADEAMRYAGQVAKASVSELFGIDPGLSRDIATDFLSSLFREGTDDSVPLAFKSYVHRSDWKASSVTSMLFEVTANGAHILTGLRSAFDWKGTATATRLTTGPVSFSSTISKRMSAQRSTAAASQSVRSGSLLRSGGDEAPDVPVVTVTGSFTYEDAMGRWQSTINWWLDYLDWLNRGGYSAPEYQTPAPVTDTKVVEDPKPVEPKPVEETPKPIDPKPVEETPKPIDDNKNTDDTKTDPLTPDTTKVEPAQVVVISGERAYSGYDQRSVDVLNSSYSYDSTIYDRQTAVTTADGTMMPEVKRITSKEWARNTLDAAPSFWKSLWNIALAVGEGKVGFGDGLSMAWDNVKYYYKGAPLETEVGRIINIGPDGVPYVTIGPIAPPPTALQQLADSAADAASEALRLAEGIPGEGIVFAGVVKIGRTATAAENVAQMEKVLDLSPDLARALSQGEERAIRKIDNIIGNFKDSDITGAIRDILDNPVPKPGGGYWDHLKEVDDAMRGLRNHAKTLENVADQAAIDARQRALALIDRVEAAFSEIGL